MKPPSKPRRGVVPSSQAGPVTRERVENALTVLAGIIASSTAEDAATTAPLYQRLERELDAFDKAADVQARARARIASGAAPRTIRPDPIAYPPRGLPRDEAARYVGVGVTKFDAMVSDGRMPRPKRVDGRVIWDRLRIDAAFGDLPDDARNPLDRILQRD
jgi:predicted DNA-binding transcriptional regulator AlpA